MIWRPLNNLVNSLKTYHLLSPDSKARREVNQWLAPRPRLSCHEWFLTYWATPKGGPSLPQPLVEFIYSRLENYSGLRVGRIRPEDRLVADLRFPAVCWFDWGLSLCEDFQKVFGVDIADTFDETQLETCADLIYFLNHKLKSCGKTFI